MAPLDTGAGFASAARRAGGHEPLFNAASNGRVVSKPTRSESHARATAPRGGIGTVLAMLGLAIASAAALISTTPARAATYKWVDEKGMVHYSDKMPPDAVDKGNVELGPSGVPVRRTDRALTPEQRRANEQEAERQKLLERQKEEVARRDRALVASYTSEAEIDLARNRSLQTINNTVTSSQAYIEQLNKRKADVESKKAEAAGKSGTAVLDRELESIEAELGRQAEVIVQKKRETAAITAKYDADKQRWRELVAAKATNDAATKVEIPGKASNAAQKSANAVNGSVPAAATPAPAPRK